MLIQQEPLVTTWYSMACCEPGEIAWAILAEGGASATQGAVALTSKNTELVSRIAARTSDKTSSGTSISP
jgi:hypothetical protein